jgi:hypothetical protein
MGGGKKGGGSDPLKQLSKESKQLFQEGTPIRKSMADQTLEVLNGGAGAFSPTGTPGNAFAAALPIFQSSVAQSQDATARTLQQLNEQFAGSKIAGTPFASRAMADARMAGNQATAGIPAQLAQKYLFGLGPLIGYNAAQTSIGGLAGGSQAFQGGQHDQLGMLSQLGSGLGSIMGKSGGSAGKGAGLGASLGKGGAAGAGDAMKLALLAV